MKKKQTYKRIVLALSLTAIISCGGSGGEENPTVSVNTRVDNKLTLISINNPQEEKKKYPEIIKDSLKLNKKGENIWNFGNDFHANYGEKIGEKEKINIIVKDTNENDKKVSYKTSRETLQDRVTNIKKGDPTKFFEWNEKDFLVNYKNLNNYTKGNKTETNQELDGSGVKIGIIDTGFENTEIYNQLLSDKNVENIFPAQNTEEVKYKDNSKNEKHGLYVTATAAMFAPRANFKVGDATNKLVDENDPEKGSLTGNNEEEIIQTMIDKGVKIINRSYGNIVDSSEYKNFNFDKFNNITLDRIHKLLEDVYNKKMTKEHFKKVYGSDFEKFEKVYWTYIQAHKKFIDEGGLIITSAGNRLDENGKENYNFTNTNVFYSTHNKLKKGMLNVGGVTDSYFVDENGKAYRNYETGVKEEKIYIDIIKKEFKGYSPATDLGKAKYGFMVAESEYRYKNGKIQNGTSVSSPAVAGTAALIKQKYPWMNGNLIRQTLITTATDIGEKGVDSVYGWGLLNISKAVNGPALFSKAAAFEDNVTVNFDNYVSVFSNNIGGDAGLIKQGNGTLVLGGYNTYTGDTKVENGKLYVTNNMTSKIINDAPATTVLSGASVASVSNSGTLYSVGNNRVASLDSAPNSVVVADSNSKITVAEKSDLSNVNLKVNIDKYVTKEGETNDYIGGNVENKYNSVSAEGNYNVKNTEKGNVNISRASMANIVAEGQESSINVANNLDSAFDSLDKEVKAGTANADVLEQAKELQKVVSSIATASSLQSLSGEVYASAQALTFEQAQTINKDLSNRLNQIGVLDDTGNGGYWLSGIGGKGKITKKGYASADTKTLGSMFGVDKKFGDNLILGTAIAYSNSDAKFDSNAGKSESKSVNISLYGRYGQKDNPVYVQGRLGLGFVDSNVERNVITGNIVNSEKINHKDKVISAYVESGYNVKKGNFTFTPYVALENDTVIRGKFKENSKFAISASKKTYNQSNATVGLRGTQSFGAVKLNGYVEYKQALNKEDLSFDSKFNGIDKDITVKGIGLNNNRTWAGVGIVHEVTPKFSWYGNYDLKLEKNKGRNNVFMIGFRVNY